MTSSRPRIGAIATATPAYEVTQASARDFLVNNYSGGLSPRNTKILRKVMSHPSVATRRFAFDSPEVLINEDPDRRVERFTGRAVQLAAEAAGKALAKAGLKPEDIDSVVVNTCTGYICPGIATYLVEKLGLNRAAGAYDLVGSGCGGAIPNLNICSGLVARNGKPVLSVSVEICSCTFRVEDDIGIIVSNAIFGDGAAAAVVWDRPPGLEIVSSASRYFPEYREDIRFVHKGGQLYNQLSHRLPELAAEAASKAAGDLLEKTGLAAGNIKHWALHPGGENVLKAIERGMGLTRENLSATREVFSRYGNMSSPTVWFVAEKTAAKASPGDLLVMLAFGAGLSAHAVLLKFN